MELSHHHSVTRSKGCNILLLQLSALVMIFSWVDGIFELSTINLCGEAKLALDQVLLHPYSSNLQILR